MADRDQNQDWNEERVAYEKADPSTDPVNEEVKESLAEDQDKDWGHDQLVDKLSEHTDESPELSGGDVDAQWAYGDDVGEETVGGTVPTPDQSRVDENGKAVGINYSDEEPLHTADKLEDRDKNRYELDPSSDPEYQERVRQEFREPMEKKQK